jgi:hypothetical protein
MVQPLLSSDEHSRSTVGEGASQLVDRGVAGDIKDAVVAPGAVSTGVVDDVVRPKPGDVHEFVGAAHSGHLCAKVPGVGSHAVQLARSRSGRPHTPAVRGGRRRAAGPPSRCQHAEILSTFNRPGERTTLHGRSAASQRSDHRLVPAFAWPRAAAAALGSTVAGRTGATSRSPLTSRYEPAATSKSPPGADSTSPTG